MNDVTDAVHISKLIYLLAVFGAILWIDFRMENARNERAREKKATSATNCALSQPYGVYAFTIEIHTVRALWLFCGSRRVRIYLFTVAVGFGRFIVFNEFVIHELQGQGRFSNTTTANHNDFVQGRSNRWFFRHRVYLFVGLAVLMWPMSMGVSVAGDFLRMSIGFSIAFSLLSRLSSLRRCCPKSFKICKLNEKIELVNF